MNLDEAERLIAVDPQLTAITPAVLSKALDGFRLPLPDLDWLAKAVQGALFASRPADHERPDRQSNTKTRDELYRIAGRLAVLWEDLGQANVDSAILDYAHRKGEPFGSAEDYRLFKEAEAKLNWLGVFLRRTGMAVEVQNRGWTLRAQRDANKLRARALAHVYREAFGLEPSAHTMPTKEPLPWPIFFSRIMVAANHPVNDLIPMLAEALDDDAESPLIIAGKFWPDKPL